MRTSVEIGDRFRDEVAEILRASGYAVETEVLVGHKRVDIQFFEESFRTIRTYVVEAKNWINPLNKTDLETIYGGYAALLRDGSHELLIVSPHTLRSPAAKAFVRDTPHVAHLSFNEFQESVLGFRAYLQAFVDRHERAGLEAYYVSPIIEGGVRLIERIDQWLQQDGGEPIAVIASYGMGKTSFAEHVSYSLAKKFLAGETCRIPILIRLGMISREQSIEGLIGAVLAGRNPSVDKYKYPIFARLNAIGRFVILFDGFDEMKHMMTHAEFLANFQELNKLTEGAGKVLLLGRPTAFLSETERHNVLRGTRPVGRTHVRGRGAPDYQEIKLQPFSAEQLSDFVSSYLRSYKSPTGERISEELFARRRIELQDYRNGDLLSRPIHARMMADLATDAQFDMAQLTRFALYDHFLDMLIERELAKSGRGKIYRAHDRRSFACELAWHLWTQTSSTGLGCRVDDLPDDLFRPYIPHGEEINSVKRDLLSGSFLDEKAGGVFFFSHKSFQEFLVAEFILNTISEPHFDEPQFTCRIIEALTDEVFDFLMEQDDGTFFDSLMSALSDCKDGFSVHSFKILCRSQRMFDIATKRSGVAFSIWDAAILLGHCIIRKNESVFEDLLRSAKFISEKSDRKPMVILSAINALLVLGGEFGIAVESLAALLIILLFARADSDLADLKTQRNKRSRSEVLQNVIFDVVSARRSHKDQSIIMHLDLVGLHEELVDKIHYPCQRPEHFAFTVDHFEAPFDEFFRNLPEMSRRAVRRFYEQDADVAGTISKELR